MKKTHRLALPVAALLALTGIGTATAVGDQPAPAPGQTLAEYMGGDAGQWDKVQTWIEAEYGDGATPTAQPTTDPTPEPTPTQDPVQEPAGEGTTGGSGGAFTNQLSRSFTSNGLTSGYHIFAEGLDPSKPIGLLMYADGSGGHGYDNPNSTYLLDADGGQGLVATSREHNMVLVVPNAPGPGCDGYDNCWYENGAPGKAQWSSDLMDRVKSQYDIDLSRVVTGGYSSGSQWQRWFLPTHGEDQSVDLAVMITYGGAPAVTADYSPEYKEDLFLAWDNGTNDSSYTSSSWGSLGGEAWYKGQGFDTRHTTVDGEDHSRGGQFAGIVDREITDNLR